MARLRRYCPSGLPQHVIQRGNNRTPCFASDQDMGAYAHYLHEAASKFRLAIHGWVFMTDHVHLLLTPAEDHSLSQSTYFLVCLRYIELNPVRAGMALGSEQFRQELEVLGGRRQRLIKRGPTRRVEG